MYRAKALGRNRLAIFDSDLRVAVDRRLRLERDLRGALGRQEFELHYQPVVSLSDASVTSCEALLRWTHRDWGAVSPVEFIPLAEENGLIVPVGAWVLGTALRQLADWRLTDSRIGMSVNVSARQLTDEGVGLMVAAWLAETGVPASALCLEVTETAVLAANIFRRRPGAERGAIDRPRRRGARPDGGKRRRQIDPAEILSGAYTPEAGRIQIDGKPVTISAPADAHRLGVRVVAQEPEIIPYVSVAENIYAGALPRRGRLVDRAALRAKVAADIQRSGFLGMIDPDQLGNSLSPAQRQLVEILRALSGDVRVIAFDEPTSSLSDRELGDAVRADKASHGVRHCGDLRFAPYEGDPARRHTRSGAA